MGSRHKKRWLDKAPYSQIGGLEDSEILIGFVDSKIDGLVVMLRRDDLAAARSRAEVPIVAVGLD